MDEHVLNEFVREKWDVYCVYVHTLISPILWSMYFWYTYVQYTNININLDVTHIYLRLSCV